MKETLLLTDFQGTSFTPLLDSKGRVRLRVAVANGRTGPYISCYVMSNIDVATVRGVWRYMEFLMKRVPAEGIPRRGDPMIAACKDFAELCMLRYGLPYRVTIGGGR